MYSAWYTHRLHNSVLVYWLACKAMPFLLMAFATPQWPPSMSAWLNVVFGLISGKRRYFSFSPGFSWRSYRTALRDSTQFVPVDVPALRCVLCAAGLIKWRYSFAFLLSCLTAHFHGEVQELFCLCVTEWELCDWHALWLLDLSDGLKSPHSI